MSDTPEHPPLPPELDPRKGLHAHRASPSHIKDPGIRRFTRALAWVATLTSAVVLVTGVGLYGYVNYLDGQITRTKVCLRNCGPQESGSAENFLLVGSDSREGDNSTGSLSGLADSSSGGQRSDTTMLVHISARSDKVSIISFPRDLYVRIPAYSTSNGTQVGPQSAKFNAAFAYGGAPLLVKMMQENFGLPIDHYIDIDFAGFKNMVNALGGIEICLSQNAFDPGDPSTGSGGSGFRETAGRHKLNGDRALQYVRQRDGLPRGDLDRVQRQQRFLASVIRKVKSAGTLLNLLKLNDFLRATFKSVTIDQDTSRDDLITLANKLKSLNPDKVQFFTVPTSGGHSAGSAGSVVDIDQASAQVLFQKIRDDVDPAKVAPSPKPTPSKSASPSPSPSPSPAEPLTVALSSIRITSLQNATATDGLGNRAASDLRALGVKVDSVTSATTTGASETTIRYGSDRADSAKSLAAAIPGSTLVADSSLSASGLQVLVGSNYTTAQAITVSGAAPSPSSSPSPGVSPTPTPAPTIQPNFNAATGDCGP